MIAFNPQGPVVSFTGATTAPTAVQATNSAGTQTQAYTITNISATIDCVVGWGNTAAQAALNAVVASGSANCYYLPFNTQRVIIAPPDAYFTGITASSTAVVKVQAGYAT